MKEKNYKVTIILEDDYFDMENEDHAKECFLENLSEEDNFEYLKACIKKIIVKKC